MKKYSFSIFYIVLSLFILRMDVFADEATCDYKTQASLTKGAAKITATSEVVEENGKRVFKITVYNITDEFYILVKPEGPNMGLKNAFMIYPSQTKDQAYSFTTDNLDNVVKYKFTVRTNIKGCLDDITSFYLTKPKRNYHFDMSYCKYKEVVDYYYCQEWIKSDFNLTDAEIEERIIKKRESLTTTTTAYCPSCELEEEQNERERRLFEIKKYIIAGLVVGIVIDLVVIGVLLHDLKRRGL